MPTYTFENKKTGEISDIIMSISEYDAYVKKNKHMRHILKPIGIADPIKLGITKPPADFQKYVLGKIKAKNPHGSVEKRWTINKEV